MIDTIPPSQLTRNHWREQTGAGERTPAMRDYSTSEGDKKRNSLGPGRFDRTFIQYVGNDDGTPIAEITNSILLDILEGIRETNNLLSKLLMDARDALVLEVNDQLLDSVSNPDG